VNCADFSTVLSIDRGFAEFRVPGSPARGGHADVGPGRSEQERRIARVVHEYEKQGFHRTGTTTDRISGDWLINEVHKTGRTPARRCAYRID
jgi:hypothetical protein